VLNRAWHATFQWIREHGVIEFLVVVVPFPIAIVVQSGNETIDRLAISLIVSLAALGSLTIVVFLINVLMAPARIAAVVGVEAKEREDEQQIQINTLSGDRDQAREKIRNLEENRPTIAVRAGSDMHSSMFLDVTNLGERGEFEAQIEVLEGREFIHGISRPILPRYTGYWERSAGSLARLPQGHSDRLLIGQQELASGGLMAASFKMYFYNPLSQKGDAYGTTSWGLMKDDGSLPARFVLRVIISSAPRILEGAFIGTYLVQGRENNLLREANEEVEATDRGD
jgi:hypothetical protein